METINRLVFAVSTTLGAAPVAMASSESELSSTVTELFPVIITFIIVILILSVLVGMFNQMLR